jgi:replication factor C subunit 1
VGNEGAINSFFQWLKDWDDVHIHGNKKEVTGGVFRYSKNWQDIPRLNAKAALVSGPPGIGKSSAVRIVCEALGFDVVELNASDDRNKLLI